MNGEEPWLIACGSVSALGRSREAEWVVCDASTPAFV